MRDPSDALSPLDVLVLRDPNAPVGPRAMRLALRLLAARGLITDASTAPARWSGGQRRLRVAPTAGDLPPALAAVAGAIRGPAAPGEVVLATTELIRRLQRAFGVGYPRFLRDQLRLPLVARGLLVVETYKQLWVFTRRRYRFTEAGLHVRARVDRDVAALDGLPALLTNAPQRAARVAASLGALVLLDDALRPHHAALAAAMREHGASDVAGAAGAMELLEDEERRERWADGIDALGHVDWGDAFDTIDGVGDAFDAGDGGDGGDGGGDGGGGDGGGSSD